MQVVGKVISILPEIKGIGKAGEWRKKDIILETESQYPKKVCIAFWGDKGDSPFLKIGNVVKIDFEMESKEYNSKWYTEVKAWRIQDHGSDVSTVVSTQAPSQQEPPLPIPASAYNSESDQVPF